MSSERGARAASGGRAPKTRAALPAWLAMLHVLGDAAWIVDARGLTLAGINHAAVELLGLNVAELHELGAPALMATPEDLAFWNDVKAGRGGQLESEAVTLAADGRLLHVTRRISPLTVARRQPVALPGGGARPQRTATRATRP